MADSSSSGSGLHRLLDSIGKCSGSNFRVWRESFEHVINIHAPELLTVLRGSARPDPLDANQATVATSWDKANSRLYSLLFFATSSSARLTVQSHRTAATSADGNGQAAWAALSARFNGRTQESPTSPTVLLGSTLQTPPRKSLRTTALLRLEESALLGRVMVHLHRPHRLLLLLRPV